jgi:hypothetical protein
MNGHEHGERRRRERVGAPFAPVGAGGAQRKFPVISLFSGNSGVETNPIDVTAEARKTRISRENLSPGSPGLLVEARRREKNSLLFSLLAGNFSAGAEGKPMPDSRPPTTPLPPGQNPVEQNRAGPGHPADILKSPFLTTIYGYSVGG